jgi:hypothetical protein
MSQRKSNRRKPVGRLEAAAAASIAVLLAGVLLSACGGGSSTASTAGSASTSASSTTPAGTRGQFRARATALRACLKKEGITLPERKPGQNGQRPGGLFSLGGGLRLPKGITRAQLQAALKKCGGNFAGARRFGGGARNTQRLAKFVACMRQNGVNLPAPNTSGKGPVFNTNGLDTASATFRKADAKCVRELIPPGGAGAGPGSGPPGGPPA